MEVYGLISYIHGRKFKECIVGLAFRFIFYLPPRTVALRDNFYNRKRPSVSRHAHGKAERKTDVSMDDLVTLVRYISQVSLLGLKTHGHLECSVNCPFPFRGKENIFS